MPTRECFKIDDGADSFWVLAEFEEAAREWYHRESGNPPDSKFPLAVRKLTEEEMQQVGVRNEEKEWEDRDEYLEWTLLDEAKEQAAEQPTGTLVLVQSFE